LHKAVCEAHRRNSKIMKISLSHNLKPRSGLRATPPPDADDIVCYEMFKYLSDKCNFSENYSIQNGRLA